MSWLLSYFLCSLFMQQNWCRYLSLHMVCTKLTVTVCSSLLLHRHSFLVQASFRQNCPWSPPLMLWFALESAAGTHQVHSLQRKLHQCVSSGGTNANPEWVFQEDRAEAEPSKASRTVWKCCPQPQGHTSSSRGSLSTLLSTLLAKSIFQTFSHLFICTGPSREFEIHSILESRNIAIAILVCFIVPKNRPYSSNRIGLHISQKYHVSEQQFVT